MDRLYSNVRQSIWREIVDMHTKLYGPLPELEKTVASTSLPRLESEFEESVGEREKKKKVFGSLFYMVIN